MLLRLILLVGMIIGAYFLFRRLRRLAWTQRVRRIAAAIGVGAVLLLLTVRGGAEIALPLLTILAPFLLRWLNAPLPSPSPGSISGAGAQSEVATRFLRMTLDHATGVMSGVIQAGGFAGRLLSDLTDQELLLLWRECQVDPESVAVLEAYLDRQGNPDWRTRFRQADTADSARTASRDSTMSRAEAYEVLGLSPGASQEEIQTAYRRLMQRLHPDHGGSAYLAARLNQARQVLLQEDL
jgi:hypothetical protein